MSVSLIDGHIDPDTNRMTDEQIIKAWEDAKKYEFVPDEFFIDKTLDLINRQQAEIERLQKAIKVLDIMTDQHEYDRRKAKAEAIKEFAERLKENKIDIDVSFGYGREVYTEAVAVIEIDNLVKEMVGEG